MADRSLATTLLDLAALVRDIDGARYLSATWTGDIMAVRIRAKSTADAVALREVVENSQDALGGLSVTVDGPFQTWPR